MTNAALLEAAIAPPESTGPEPLIDRASAAFPPARAPRIVMAWLLRLRWLAIGGQVAATLVALMLGLAVPPLPVAIVVTVTAASNALLFAWMRGGREISTGLILAVLLVDMCLLTALLHYTGGADNPFGTLYLVHIAMAVTTLGGAWTWVVVAAAAGLYATLFVHPVPLTPSGDLPPALQRIGSWASLVIIGGLIGYFSGRVNRSVRRRDAQIIALRERNARNEKLTTLTTLAAGAAHELGTPLATIAVVARELELAIAKLPASPELIEDAKLIRQECDRCRFILDRMRVDVASDTRAARTSLDELLSRLDQHLREDERQRLAISGLTSGYAVAASCPAIEQSLTVMIRNAMDADANGQPVRLVIRIVRDCMSFDVIDRGHGMSSEVLKRAGEPFFTTKEPGRGMGLGLFLVRLVAENYGGNFSMTSRPNEGTQSTLELPLDLSGRAVSRT